MFYVFTKQFQRDIARILQGLDSVKRVQQVEIEMAKNEKELTEELIGELEGTTDAIVAVEQAVDGLLNIIQSQSDVSPGVQAAIDKVKEQRSRIAAAALKGTQSAPTEG
jgi:nicotinate-nucleotide pyrophosphorylase